MEIETCLHLFVQCQHTNRFWREFESLWADITSDHIILSEKYIIFGIYDLPYIPKFLNYCIIEGKQYIFEYKESKKLSIKSFLRKLIYNSKVEKEIAKTYDKMQVYIKKWKIFNDFTSMR